MDLKPGLQIIGVNLEDRRDRVKQCLKHFDCEEDLLEDEIYIRKRKDLDGEEYYYVAVSTYQSQRSTIEEASEEIAMSYWKTKILREFRKFGYHVDQLGISVFNQGHHAGKEVYKVEAFHEGRYYYDGYAETIEEAYQKILTEWETK